MSPLLSITHFVGIFVAWLVYHRRSRLDEIGHAQGIDWRQFLIPNPAFFALTFLKMLFWEVVLAHWLITGGKGSPWIATTEVDGREVRRIQRVQPSSQTAGTDR